MVSTEVLLGDGSDLFVLDTKSRRIFLVDGERRSEVTDSLTKLKILAESSAMPDNSERKSSTAS